MESSQVRTDNFQEIFNRNEKVILTKNLNCLYPNRDLINHEIRWFKACLDRGLRPDLAA